MPQIADISAAALMVAGSNVKNDDAKFSLFWTQRDQTPNSIDGTID
jgi:hypothetical protein